MFANFEIHDCFFSVPNRSCRAETLAKRRKRPSATGPSAKRERSTSAMSSAYTRRQVPGERLSASAVRNGSSARTKSAVLKGSPV